MANLKDFFNKISNNNRIFTAEDIGEMSGNEYLQNENRFRKHCFPIPFLKEPGVVLDMDYYLKGPFFTKYLTAMYRKAAMDSCQYLKYDISIDMAMFYALLTQGKAFLMTDVMGCYRMHDGGVYAGKDRSPLLRDFFSNMYLFMSFIITYFIFL